MAKKVYVGNLSFSATEEDVRDLFSEFGDVESVAMINDRDTGRFRGFCFVEMAPSAADAAIAALDGKEVGGRNLRVNEARPREERSGGGGNRSGGGGSRSGGGRGDSRGGSSRGGGGDNYGRRNDYNDSGNSRRW
ncbi:MAG: RNA-binding protein [Chloroflexi bacterium]|nr:RNA-binding protein [Chloroflexota bacterium]MBK6712617.1 RNA-binding protein [Chloroflexota bacterium]MBK7178190.1 RNA-binding protein [Chloroflexota bacterium]MBK7916297.1 RNA-binding protein [Chloroflexota bacterium]MBK8930722.1 RNA-binding protein [Chloroflexota bacterium]